MKPKSTLRAFLIGCSSLLATPFLHAVDGTWTADANGNWGTLANWNFTAGPIADGTDGTATLADVAANVIITNDGRTIGNITVSDPDNNYTISSNTLTLDVTSGSPTISVPSGRTLTISSAVAGTVGFTKTGDGTLTSSSTGTTLEGDVTVSGGLVNWAQNGSRTFTSLSGSGDFYRLGGDNTLTIEDGSAFTGSLATFAGGNSSHTIQFQSMGDGGNLITRGGTGDSNQSTTFRLYGDVGAVTFNTRAIEILSQLPTPKNWSGRASVLDNDNATPANAWVINTNLINETDRDHELVLRGSNTGDNTFAGAIGDSTGIGGLGVFYSTQTGGLSLIKQEAGKWILTGVNAYTRCSLDSAGTIVIQGTLVIGGAGQLGGGSYGEAISINAGADLIVDSSATNTFTGPFTSATTGSNKWGSSSGTGTLTQTGTGVLTLGDGTNNASLNDYMTVSVETGSVINLDYLAGNTDTVLNLVLGGVTQAAGIYDSTSHPAYFTGSGRINNLAGDTTPLEIGFFDGTTADIVGPGNTASNVTASSNTWDDTLLNWDYGNGVDHAAWLNTLTSEAVFAGSTNRNITVGSDVNVGTMTMNSYGYIFNGTNTITFGPTGVINANTDNNRTRLTEFNCNVAGGDITVNGTGWVRMDGTATNSSFTINNTGGIGELPSGTYNGFGPGVVTINANTSIWSTNNDPTDIPNDMVWNSSFRIENVSTSAKVLTFDGDVTLGADITLSAKHTVVLNGVISDGGNNYQLTLQDNSGGATFDLNGANTFGGGVNWIEDSLNINNASALGTGTFTLSGGLTALDNTSGGPITVSTNNAQAWNTNFTFTGSNDLNLGTGAVTMNADRTVTVSAGTLTVGGNIGGGNRKLTKAGAGTLVLGGDNTYTNSTVVNAGTLTINGSLADSSMTIAGGTVNGTGTLAFKINGTAFDQVVMTSGALDVTAMTLEIPAGAILDQPEYVVVNNTGGTLTSTGQFSNLIDTAGSGYVLDYGTANQIKLVPGGGGGNPYDTWSGGAAFTDDANGDGVDNGLAWILGAANPGVSALNKLPTVTTPTGFLQLDFTRENPYAPAKLYVEYGNDLTGWTKLELPAGTGTIGGDIEVTVAAGPPDSVTVKIPTTHAAGGKLFARLSATEN